MYRTNFCTIAGDVHQANPDAPVDESTTQSKDDEVNEARTNLTRRDPVHCESKWERFSQTQDSRVIRDLLLLSKR